MVGQVVSKGSLPLLRSLCRLTSLGSSESRDGLSQRRKGKATAMGCCSSSTNTRESSVSSLPGLAEKIVYPKQQAPGGLQVQGRACLFSRPWQKLLHRPLTKALRCRFGSQLQAGYRAFLSEGHQPLSKQTAGYLLPLLKVVGGQRLPTTV